MGIKKRKREAEGEEEGEEEVVEEDIDDEGEDADDVDMLDIEAPLSYVSSPLLSSSLSLRLFSSFNVILSETNG